MGVIEGVALFIFVALVIAVIWLVGRVIDLEGEVNLHGFAIHSRAHVTKMCRHCGSAMLIETRFIPDVVPGGFNTGKTKAIRFFYCGCCGKFEVVEGTEQEVATALGRSTAGDGLDFSGPEITD